MKISVIIPVKNRASLLPVTLRNILAQTLQPYEIIVVDDGSTDNMGEVIDEFKSAVIFVNSEGKGPGAARNTGLRIATGKYIQFFDSDDLITRNKLQVQAELLEEKNADFVYGPSVKAVYSEGGWQQADVIMQYFPLPSQSLADLVLEGWCAITQSVLFTKAFIDSVGFWREDLMPHEDYEYWFRIGKTTNRFFHENQSCVIYRQHHNQITDQATTAKAKWLDGLTAMTHINNGIDYKASLKSRIIFKGRNASSKLNFIKKYGKLPDINMNISDYMSIPFYKISNKIERIQTGSDWQKKNGVLSPGAEKFKEYVMNL